MAGLVIVTWAGCSRRGVGREILGSGVGLVGGPLSRLTLTVPAAALAYGEVPAQTRIHEGTLPQARCEELSGRVAGR